MARLTKEQAIAAEDEMRRLEEDPNVSKKELRLYMQSLMPCGHLMTNLLTCPDPPYGCVGCLKNEHGFFEDGDGTIYAGYIDSEDNMHYGTLSAIQPSMVLRRTSNDGLRQLKFADGLQKFLDQAQHVTADPKPPPFKERYFRVKSGFIHKAIPTWDRKERGDFVGKFYTDRPYGDRILIGLNNLLYWWEENQLEEVTEKEYQEHLERQKGNAK